MPAGEVKVQRRTSNRATMGFWGADLDTNNVFMVPAASRTADTVAGHPAVHPPWHMHCVRPVVCLWWFDILQG